MKFQPPVLRRDELRESPPSSSLRMLLAAFLSWAPVLAADPAGYSYHHETVPEVPWSIHVVKVDRAQAGLQLQTVLAEGTSIGLGSLHDQVRLIPAAAGRPLVAINGDFYDKRRPYAGDPRGVQIMRGELVSAPNEWSCLWVNASGELSMGRLESKLAVAWPDGTVTPMGLNERRLTDAAVLYTPAVGASTRTSGGREFVLEPAASSVALPLKIGENYTFRIKEIRNAGDTRVSSHLPVLSVGPGLTRSIPKVEPGALLKISTETIPSIQGAVTAISGGPALVRDGKLVQNRSELRHPRAAVGWNKTHFYFVEVDGRQPRLSLGMTYNEIGNYMLKLGCDEALNLDGGGSATLWVLGQTVNHPAQGYDRSVANALVLVQSPQPAPEL